MAEFDELMAQYQVAREIGDLAQAQALLERALEIEPDNAQLWGDLCWVLSRQRQFVAALAALDYPQRAVAEEDKTAYYYELRGFCFYRLDRWGEAEQCFRLALQEESKPHLWNRLGHTLWLANGNEEAIECYRRALEIDAANTRSLLLLAQALRSRKGQHENLQERETLLRRAVAIAPDDAEVWNDLGALLNGKYSVTKDEEILREARSSLARALYLNPHDVWARIHFGNVLWKCEELENAEENFRRAYQDVPDDDDLLHFAVGALLADFLSAEQIDAEQAERLLRAAIAHDAENVGHNYILGKHLYRLERDEEARPFLQFAAEHGHKRAAELLRKLNTQ